MPVLVLMSLLAEWPAQLLDRVGGARGEERERGDVPGWVLVTVMTAALVVALLAVAGPKLSSAFTKAIDSVSG